MPSSSSTTRLSHSPFSGPGAPPSRTWASGSIRRPRWRRPGGRLRESGLVTLEERDTACCYARQDKVWVADPAGNRWEVYTVLADIGEDEDDNEQAGAPACCAPTAPAAGCCSGN